MKTIITRLAYIFTAGLFMYACGKELPVDNQPQNSDITINQNQAELQKRIHFQREMLDDELKSFNPIDLELVASVESPKVNGITLAATHVQFKGNLVYVTYHSFDEPYGGAIDVFDVSDPDNPVLLQQLTNVNTDFHNLDLNASDLYVAGAKSTDESGYDVNYTKGAVAQRYTLDGGGLLTPTMVEVPLPSYSANSIRYNSTGVLVSTGDLGGGSFILDKTSLTLLEDIGVEDAKYIHGTADYLAVLAGEGASSRLYIFNGNSLTTSPMEVALGNVDVTNVGKNAIECYDDYILVNLGDDGLRQINRYNGNTIGQYNFTDGDGIAIAAVEFGQFTVLAYGCDGILVLDKKSNTYRKIASYKFTQNGSVNHVASNGDVIFAASGLQGLRILRNVQKNCTALDAPDGNVQRAVWLEAYYPATFTPQAFAWEGGSGDFVQHPDGKAQATGIVYSLKNPNDKWEVNINLSDKMNWTQWSGQGRSFMAGPNHVAGSEKDWFYYIMDVSNPSTLVGLGDNAGLVKELDHKPSGYKFGFQLGYGANVKSLNYGIGGWFSYENSAGDRRTGDLNVDITGC